MKSWSRKWHLNIFYDYFLAPGPQGNDGNGGFNMMFILMAWLVAAVILFLLRPQNMRQSGNEKPSNQVNSLFFTFCTYICCTTAGNSQLPIANDIVRGHAHALVLGRCIQMHNQKHCCSEQRMLCSHIVNPCNHLAVYAKNYGKVSAKS